MIFHKLRPKIIEQSRFLTKRVRLDLFKAQKSRSFRYDSCGSRLDWIVNLKAIPTIWFVFKFNFCSDDREVTIKEEGISLAGGGLEEKGNKQNLVQTNVE